MYPHAGDASGFVDATLLLAVYNRYNPPRSAVRRSRLHNWSISISLAGNFPFVKLHGCQLRGQYLHNQIQRTIRPTHCATSDSLLLDTSVCRVDRLEAARYLHSRCLACLAPVYIYQLLLLHLFCRKSDWPPTIIVNICRCKTPPTSISWLSSMSLQLRHLPLSHHTN
jgi:hypothetical protein